jgi:pimeloyl-ACP methyl ester carboxylesterase
VKWHWQGHEVTLGVDELGKGPPVLLLPALSSISTRHEMRPLMQALADEWHLIATDWPGFGDLPKPPIAWTPDSLSAFLAWFAREQVPTLHATVAAGHAASYALHFAARHPNVLGRLALLAPTWRGPLPTMAGGDRPMFTRIRRAVAMPVIGPAIYRLNVNPFVIRMMVAGHVYTDMRHLSAEQKQEKKQVVRAPGARFGSAAFVTGGLDRVQNRKAFLDLVRGTGEAIIVAYSNNTPAKSRAEMDALAALPSVHSLVTTRGKLSFYEECPEDAAQAVRQLLADAAP